MLKADSSTKQRRHAAGKKFKKKVTMVEGPSVAALQKIKAVSNAEYGQPKSTTKNYEGYVKQGKQFLVDLVKRRQAEGGASDELDDVNTDELERAFDDEKPNRYSVMALELFLTEKCLNEGHGKSTANGIHGAWARFWDKM